MRILFCSEQPPLLPLDDGIRLPLYSLLRELETRHDVRVVALYDRDRPESDPGSRSIRLVPRPRTDALRNAAVAIRAEITGRPLRADSLAKRLRPILRDEIGSFRPDVVHVVSGQLASVRSEFADRPGVLVAQDAWYRNVEALAVGASGVRRLVYEREVARVQRFEAREYQRYEAVTVVTPEDARALDSLVPGLALHVIPNGVDGQFFSPEPATSRSAGNIVFHGNLCYAPTVIAAHMLAEQILPLVRAEVPEATVTIVGRRPVPSIAALDQADRGVRVVGDPDDVRPWLRSAAVYAAPITTGTGIKNKVLEAMACGLPCVATPRALQGLEARSGHDVIVARSPREFAASLRSLLLDPVGARRIGNRAREYVTRAHDWGAVARHYEDVYRAAVVAHDSEPNRTT